MIQLLRYPIVSAFAWACISVSALGQSTYEYHHENVMGGPLTIHIRAAHPSSASDAEAAVLREIDRLSAVFSTYDKESEFSRWLQSQGRPVAVSAELHRTMLASNHWQAVSNGMFNPASALASQMWRSTEASGRAPSEELIARTAVKINQPFWSIDKENARATRLSDTPLVLNAIAVGTIMDSCAQVALRVPGVDGVVIDAAGDAIVAGDITQIFEIHAPDAKSVNEPAVALVSVRGRAITTSGSTHRGFVIAGRKYSHIIDPRTAKPVDRTLNATVIADSAEDADAIATILCVAGVKQGIEFVESLDRVACLLVDADGHLYPSSRWPRSENTIRTIAMRKDGDGEAKPAPDWNNGMELEIEFDINRVGGGRYRRPYVVAWVEDKDGFPVKTLILWVQTEGPGPRWIPDLRQWQRSDRVRQLAEERDLVPLVSEPTRKPGHYTVVWDGTDNDGTLVPKGEYTIHLEAAREHGTYQLVKKTETFGETAFETSLEDGEELKSINLTYRKRETRENGDK